MTNGPVPKNEPVCARGHSPSVSPETTESGLDRGAEPRRARRACPEDITPEALVTITYVLNNRSGVLHKLVDGRAHESCNTDQLKSKQVLTAEPWEVKRYCKRCWEWE